MAQQDVQRKLTAILSADGVGYGPLTRANEEAAVENIQAAAGESLVSFTSTSGRNDRFS